jgi:hypothetical protein
MAGYVGRQCHEVNRQSNSGSSNFFLPVSSIRYAYSAGHFHKSSDSWSYKPPPASRHFFLPGIKLRSPCLSIFRQFLANQYKVWAGSDLYPENPWFIMQTFCPRDFRLDGSQADSSVVYSGMHSISSNYSCHKIRRDSRKKGLLYAQILCRHSKSQGAC